MREVLVPLHLYILVLAVEMQNLEWKAYIFQNSSDKMDEVNKILFYLKRIAAPFLAVSTSMTHPTGASAVGRPVRLRVSSKEGVELWPRPRHRSDIRPVLSGSGRNAGLTACPQ